MRLLLTTDTIGGVWTFTRELCLELLELGHAVALVSFGRKPSRDQAKWCLVTSRRYPRDFRHEAFETPLEWMQGNAASYAEAKPALLRIAKEFEPDLLHSSQYCFGSLPVDIPKVITAHSDVLSWAIACRPHGLEPSPWLDRYRNLVQKGLDGADAVVAPTRWMLEALASGFALPARRSVIPNGRTIRCPSSPQQRRLEAVTVGRFWDEAKNIALLTKLASPIPIAVAGDRSHEDTHAARHCGQLSILESLGEDDLMTLYRRCSIYIALSVYEPFGLAPLEAALCGCAVLANYIPSIREVWGDAALYFHDARSLETLLHRLKDSPALLRSAQHRSSLRAKQLSARRMLSGYMDVYAKLLGVSEPAHAEAVDSRNELPEGSAAYAW